MGACCVGWVNPSSGGHRRIQEQMCKLPLTCSVTCANVWGPWLHDCGDVMTQAGIMVEEEFAEFSKLCSETAKTNIKGCGLKCGDHGGCHIVGVPPRPACVCRDR